MAIIKISFDPEMRIAEVFNKTVGAYRSKFSSKLIKVTFEELLSSYLEKYCSAQTLSQLEQIDQSLIKEIHDYFKQSEPYPTISVLKNRNPMTSPSVFPYIGDPVMPPDFWK